MSPDKPEPTEPTDDITDPPDADTDVVEQAEAEADAPDKDTEVAEQAEADAPPTPAEESPTEDKPAVPARERGGKRRLLLIVLGVAVLMAKWLAARDRADSEFYHEPRQTRAD